MRSNCDPRAARVRTWLKAQGQDFNHGMFEEIALGPIYSDSWLRDPKHLGFVLARYKFAARMLHGADLVAEVGAGDGWPGRIVAQEVSRLELFDLAPLGPEIQYYDIASGTLGKTFDAIYSIDVFEHFPDGAKFFQNLTDSLRSHGRMIVGTPSRESQVYASAPSKKLHVNCLSGDELRELASEFFHHVFMFSMNDEVIHTGFMPMAHYLWAVCAEPRGPLS